MPELPEVETIRLALQKDIVGKTISDIEVLEKKQFYGKVKELRGKKISDILRKGKVLSLKLSDNKYLSFHLKLSGQILYSKNREDAHFSNEIPRANSNKMPGKTTRIIIDFDDGSVLFFNDLRKFGWIKYSDKPEIPKSPDILSEEFIQEYFDKTISKTTRPIKIVLIDQDKMSGIGNIYANDSLFNANIDPRRKASSLSLDEAKKLFHSIIKTIKEGIKQGGSSARDELYILPNGGKGNYQNHFKVYHQEGKKCPNSCGEKIKRIKQGGRSSFFCPNCQK